MISPPIISARSHRRFANPGHHVRCAIFASILASACSLGADNILTEQEKRDGWLLRPMRNLGCLALYFAGLSPTVIRRLYG